MGIRALMKSTPFYVVTVFFIELVLIWCFLHLASPKSQDPYYFFGATYGLVALIGGVFGLFAAKKWGGLKSSLGRTVLLLAAGLLFAEFGQLVFSYYNIVLHVEIPYPSVADIGFLGNIPLYILAGTTLAGVLGLKRSLSTSKWKYILLVALPLTILGASYWFFLTGYSTLERSALTVFLDFAYPLGQAVYITVALLIIVGVTSKLGGIMRPRVWLLLFAFAAQYIADFNFLYQTYHETWVNGGYGDLLYLTAYYLMSVGLIFLTQDISKKPEATSNSSET